MTRQSRIQRESPCSLHDHDESERDNDEVVFNSVARLVAKPVQEKSVFQMNHERRDDHCDRNAQSRDARQESNDQTEAAKKLCRNGEARERCWNPQLIPKSAYRDAEALAAKPAQKLLCPVSE